MGKDDYEVGYKKPPKSGQFKPGKSGNPKGKVKGKKDLKTELEEELFEMIAIKEQGATKKVSKQRAMLKAITARAVQGDTKAATLLVNMVYRLLNDTQALEDDPDLTAADEAILAHLETQVLKKAKYKEKADDEQA